MIQSRWESQSAATRGTSHWVSWSSWHGPFRARSCKTPHRETVGLEIPYRVWSEEDGPTRHNSAKRPRSAIRSRLAQDQQEAYHAKAFELCELGHLVNKYFTQCHTAGDIEFFEVLAQVNGEVVEERVGELVTVEEAQRR